MEKAFSDLQPQEVNSDDSIQRVIGVSQKFGKPHFVLACHAAFPLALTPDLLYRIWARFLPTSPWTAVADVLLSSLCNEVSFELYEMDISVRKLLLNELKENTEYGEKRLSELALFLTDYINWQSPESDIEEAALAKSQKWTALAYLNPMDMATEFVQEVSNLNNEDINDILRLTSLVETLSLPLDNLYPVLLCYSKGKLFLALGDNAQSNYLFRKANSLLESVNSQTVNGAKVILHELIKNDISQHGPATPKGDNTAFQEHQIGSLLSILPETYTNADRELVQRAFLVAREAHKFQTRNSGEPYINHCLGVAGILAKLQASPELVAAGLLHDTIIDTNVTLDDIRRDFGDTIAGLLDGVTKLTNLPRVSRVDEHGESGKNRNEVNENETEPKLADRQKEMASEVLRKNFLAMGDDVRVVLIKLADRLHNMRSLGNMPADKRKRIAQQTLDIFAPLATRLGIWQFKWELEDLSFRYINPEKYKEIVEQLAERQPDRDAEIAKIITGMKKILEKDDIKAIVTGRAKHIYSIYRKMEGEKKQLEMIRDLRGIRLIVPDLEACYRTLGLIHTNWRPIPGEFDDYIAAPKDNFYQSLHTAVIWDDGKPLEVQIRTDEMNENAEYGMAAAWRVKEGTRFDKLDKQSIKLLHNMMEWRSDAKDSQEFIESIKADNFRDRVYVFTPRGDIIDLPSGSTPIDFAYQIHTDIGHRCRGARINGKLAPLYQELKTGDQVNILTINRGGPSPEWLNPNLGLVKTQQAKQKIRSWFRKHQDNQTVS